MFWVIYQILKDLHVEKKTKTSVNTKAKSLFMRSYFGGSLRYKSSKMLIGRRKPKHQQKTLKDEEFNYYGQ